LREVGFVVGRTSTKWVTVRLEEEVGVNDLVMVGGRLLGVVRGTSYANPTMSPFSPFVPRDSRAARAYEYLNAQVELYGTIGEGGFTPRVLTAVSTGARVELVERGDLEGLKLVDDPIYIGVHPASGWPLPLDPRAVDYHIAVVGATGSGKSHLVRLLAAALAKQGRSVVVFDHTGLDYVEQLSHLGRVIRDTEVFPELSSIAEVIVQEVFRDDKLMDDVEIALYTYVASDGDLGRAEALLDSIGLVEYSKRGVRASFNPSWEAWSKEPSEVEWSGIKFQEVLDTVMLRVGRHASTRARARFRLMKSGLDLSKLGGREVKAEEIVDRALEGGVTVVDISTEPMPVRYSIVRSVVSGLLRRAEMERRRVDTAIVVDEAQIYAAKGQPTAGVLADVARRGRKWGLGLVLASQRWVADLDPGIRANVNSVVFSSLQASTDLEDIGRVVSVSAVDVDVLGTGDFYVCGLLSPFRRPILVHTFSKLEDAYAGRGA